MNTDKKYFILDMGVLLTRSLKHMMRSIDTVITVCITPIAIMLMFVYVFGGSLGGGMSTADYVVFSLPGILLISIASAIAYTAIRLFSDMKSGLFDRFKAMPISASAVLWAHVLTSLVSNAITLTIIFVVAMLMGFRSYASIYHWLAIIGILVLFTLALTWVAVIAGLKAKSEEGASAFSYPLVFLPFISSAFLPTDNMPEIIKVFAEHQPITAIVECIRLLFANDAVNQNIWIALAWCLGILIIAYLIAMHVYRKNIN